MLNLAHLLTLERPLAVLDLETTGLDPKKDRVCQIGITIHYSVDRDPIAWDTLVNPTVPILNGKESHGITDADVQGAPTFRDFAHELARKILQVDIAGYNVAFDIKFLREEMARAGAAWPWDGHVIDAFPIFRKKHPHTLTNAFLRYGGDEGGPVEAHTLEGAHDASVDVQATGRVLRGQLLTHTDLPRTVKELAEWCFPVKPNAIDKEGKFVWNAEGVPCIAFGKHAVGGPTPMTKVPKDYYRFIQNSDFPEDCRQIAAAALMGIYPRKE